MGTHVSENELQNTVHAYHSAPDPPPPSPLIEIDHRNPRNLEALIDLSSIENAG